TMSHTFARVQASVASARRALRTLRTEPELRDRPGAVEAGRLRGHIQFRDVRFRYDDEAPVLEGVSFDAEPGRMIALVGLTGAGKTSLVSLIPRFYDVISGEALVDGRDVRDTSYARSATRSASSCRSRCSSRARSPTTSATGGSTRLTKR